MEIQWNKTNRAFVGCDTHVLCLGGPGSGKTTMALLKANRIQSEGSLHVGQKMLFLSFARATISRVEEHASKILNKDSSSQLEITTYHGFIWNILRSHGYLLCSRSPIRLHPPHEAASEYSHISGKAAKAQKMKERFENEGLLNFDIFAWAACELLSRSHAIRKLISSIYPIIILDEFQDTNDDEWRLIRLLGQNSRLVALADPEQRIYEFRGASPERIPEFIEAYSPTKFDFAGANHRSDGTDICQYGNDLLSGTNSDNEYDDVEVSTYPIRKGAGRHMHLKAKIWERLKTLKKDGVKNWSIAVLVPTKQLMLEVSTFLAAKQDLNNGKKAPALENEAALDAEAPALAAVLIAGVMAGANEPTAKNQLVMNLASHIRGRKGSAKPNQQDLKLADALDEYVRTGKLRGSKREAIVKDCIGIVSAARELVFAGDPSADWLKVRALFEGASSETVCRVAEDARYLRFLNRGTELRASLAELWRNSESYKGADQAVSAALIKEHFLASKREYRGIHVMTIHKSKGKQFTEVVLYEGLYQGRFLRINADERERAQSVLSLRVGVTRAERHVSILTPAVDPCELIV